MNFPAFDEAASDLRRYNYDVVSPAELDSPESRAAALASTDGDPVGYAEGETWGGFLARDVKLIADTGIEAIVCLPGWEKSRGARLETFVGRLCGLEILEYPSLGKVTPGSIDIAHASKAVATSRLLDLRLEEDRLYPLITAPGTLTAPAGLIENARAELGFVSEVRITDTETGGQKGQKAQQLGAIDPDAIMLVAEVAGFGATKYARLNYLRGFDWSLSYDALQRHAHEFWAGREIDPESGLPHMAHAAWQCMCLLSFRTRGLGTDDRISAMPNLQ